jgi:competence ComEA-like helix-hairpin-helix protein
MAVLAVVVVGTFYAVRLELQVARNRADVIQAHYLALAGIEKAKGLLYQDAAERKRGATHHSAALYDSPDDFRDIAFGRGHFSVLRQGSRDEGGSVIYGISDEESRLNVNRASSTELGRLYQIRPEIVAAIVDWRDGNNTPSTGGAEMEYYATLQPPYMPRNAPFQTLREVQMVRGITREDFKGEDDNLNGWLDPDEDDGSETLPVDNQDRVLDAGWSALLTVESSVRNITAAGESRINLQSAEEKALATVPGISAEIAKAIVAYRGQKQIENLAHLLDVTAPRPPGQPQATGTNQPTGPKVIDQNLLMEIADHVTAKSEEDLPGAINLNTASAEVLACLSNVSLELAQAIVAYRKSAGFFPNVAHLLKVDGMTRQIFEPISSKVSVRSETFRIRSEGKVPSSGARTAIEVMVRLGASSFETLGYREDL